MGKKVIIFSAPSGAGKSTIVGHCLQRYRQLEFSISATSRAPRGQEQNGREYYFMSIDEFRKRVADNEFVEWEEVYAGFCYGTLKSEVQRIWDAGKVIIFDVDVKGGVNLKKYFGEDALSVFIKAPSLEVLRQRLEGRGTDTPEAIERRLAKANEEIEFADGKFDFVLVNDDLQKAFDDMDRVLDSVL